MRTGLRTATITFNRANTFKKYVRSLSFKRAATFSHTPRFTSIPEKSAASELIYENALKKAYQDITVNLSWINASLIAEAFKNTFEIYVNKHRLYKWVLFIIVFILSVLLSMLPQLIDSTEELKQELDLTKENEFAARGDIEYIEKQREKIENIRKKACGEKRKNAEKQSRHFLHDKHRISGRILQFVEVEFDIFKEQSEALLLAILGNFVAITLKDAIYYNLISLHVEYQFKVFLGFSVVLTIVGVYATIRTGTFFDNFKDKSYEKLEECEKRIENGKNEYNRQLKAILLRFSFVKRFIRLFQYTLAFILAWSWQQTVKWMTLTSYGGTTEDLVGIIVYVVIVTFIVAFLESMNNVYFIFYPRNESMQKNYHKSKSRGVLNRMLSKNIRYVVGLGWFTFINYLLIINLKQVAIKYYALYYWLLSIFLIILSVIVQFYIKKHNLQQKIETKGITQTVFDSFENFFDPKYVLHAKDDKNDINEITYIIDHILVKSIDLIGYGLGISGSLTIMYAVKYLLYSINHQYYTIDSDTIESKGIYALWIATLLSFLVSVGIMAYFGRIVKFVERKRKGLFQYIRAFVNSNFQNLLSPIKNNNNDKMMIERISVIQPRDPQPRSPLFNTR